jgi:hypothetical protein
MNFQISRDAIVILLSVFLPILLSVKQEIDKKISISIWEIYTYLNKEELNKRDNYFRWHTILIPNQREMIKFLIGLGINDTNPLLLPGRSGDENNLIRNNKKKLGRFSTIRMILSWGIYIIPIIIVVLLFVA